jgi:hypothetical protein
MSAHSGLRLSSTDGMIFYVDGRNSRSTSNNKIRDLISGEEQPFTQNTVDSYFYTDYNSVEKFISPQLSNLDSFTVNVLVANEPGKSGFAFSITTDDIIGYTTDKVAIGYEYIDSSTTSPLSTAYANVTHSATADSSYEYMQSSVNATVSYQVDQTLSASPNISYEYAEASTTAITSKQYVGITHTASADNSYEYIPASVVATTLKGYNLSTAFEISTYIKSNQVIVTNKANNNTTSLVHSSNTNKTQYSIIYRKYSEDSVPISLYVNGDFVLDTGIVAGESQFENFGISLFNKLNIDLSEYGDRSISIYKFNKTSECIS